MKRIIFSITMLIGASIMFISCGAPAANNASNAGNKPANAANTAAAPAADKAAVETDIKKMMDDFAAALNKGDVDSLGKMYSDDYTLIDANGGMQTKATRLEGIKSGRVKMEGLKFNDLKIKTNPAGDGAAVTGRVTGKTTTDGKAEENNSMVTWVIGKSKDKGWQFVNAQITNIKADAAKTDDKKAEEKKADSAPAANK
jgi:ketosteroid isomerase-like protein